MLWQDAIDIEHANANMSVDIAPLKKTSKRKRKTVANDPETEEQEPDVLHSQSKAHTASLNSD